MVFWQPLGRFEYATPYTSIQGDHSPDVCTCFAATMVQLAAVRRRRTMAGSTTRRLGLVSRCRCRPWPTACRFEAPRPTACRFEPLRPAV
eukprot:366328-Chlamydomonas_euryale.AAC.14